MTTVDDRIWLEKERLRAENERLRAERYSPAAWAERGAEIGRLRTEVVGLRADNRSHETVTARYADKVVQLEAEIERLHGQIEGDAESIAHLTARVNLLPEAAAFLDQMAAKLEGAIVPSHWIEDGFTAADCRAMAKKLRGKT